MKDSILKGTGNSRFLKSAVPAGTSWADALAMLQAGTFPIDFNGINTEGFQQVGTPLNKANLLKDVNALTLGLAGDATPNDMFNVLAHAGDLHVWRKTVVTKEPIPEVPGSYTLGSAAITNLARMTSNGYNGYAANILVSKEIKVNLDGSVELVSPTSRQMIVAGSSDRYTIDVNSDDLLGAGNRYFTPSEDSDSNSSRCTLLIPPGTVYYVAPGTTYTTAMREIGFTSAFNAAQLVTGVPGTPAIPAGTTVTYPVSTNPNAYQEGNDAKPAGYTLGEVVTMRLMYNGIGSGHYVAFDVSDSVSVNDSGDVSLAQNTSVVELKPTNTAQFDSMRGKFFVNRGRVQCSTEIVDDKIYFIPSDATVNVSSDDGGNIITCDKVQLVTGYAAIPANTTIEYLGCLGDKVMVQVVSYVGTGTYGEDNPCSLTFDFPPKVAIMVGFMYSRGNTDKLSEFNTSVIFNSLNTAYKNYKGFCFYQFISSSYAKISDDGKTLTWYTNPNSAYQQCNASGATYYILAIG